MYCSCQLFVEIISSIVIILLCVPSIPLYLIGLIFPAIIILFILRLIGCKSRLPTIFELYLYYIFWPYTWLLCWIKIPLMRCKYGYNVLYLGKIKRKRLQNDYNKLKENIHLINVSHLNKQFKAFNIKERSRKHLRIICISDTHGRHSWLNNNIPNGDILIHCGDITFQGNGAVKSLKSFNKWIKQFKHKYKFLIGGNHDAIMPSMQYISLKNNIFNNCIYLDNNNFIIKEFNNFCIFGCGWSPKGSNNNAFQHINDNMLHINQSKVDILLSHSDMSNLNRYYYANKGKQINDIMHSVKKCKAFIHVCGHFHARYGVKIRNNFYNDGGDMMVVNCSSLDGRYVPSHYPVVFDVEL